MVAPDRVNAEEGHKDLPIQVLDDVLCSFIRGIEAAESARPD
jgi:hypothetical protein